MFDKELENFLQKFHQLRRAGLTAHLDLDTFAGQAWVGLRVMLGPVQQKHQDHPKPKSRSPSYFRRQERRRAAKAASSSEQSSDIVNAAEANTEQSSDASKEAVEASSEYACEICDFKSNKESGLNIHMSRKHPVLEQIDGNTEDFEDFETEFDNEIEEYLSTGSFPESDSLWYEQFWEDLLGYLKSRKEKLEALEAYRKLLEKKKGMGSYLGYAPWNYPSELREKMGFQDP